MRIEKEIPQFGSLNLEQIRMDRKLTSARGGAAFSLSKFHLDFLARLYSANTLQTIVLDYFNSGEFPPFEAMRELLEFLVEEKILLNAGFAEYFQRHEAEAPGLFEGVMEKLFGSKHEPVPVAEKLEKLPFFRSLKPQVRKVFLKNSRVVDAPAGVSVCESGKKQRSLFVLLKGQASVYKENADGALQKVAVLPSGSVFGETGFFMGKPRTATVITDKNCRLLQIYYVAEIFDPLMKSRSAEDLQQRLWVVHALLKSEIFRNVPQDCFDALIFAGSLIEFEKSEWIVREGKRGDTCYVIVQGTVVVSQNGKTIRKLSQGDCFGEIALVVTGGIRSASVHAATDVLALAIPAAKFWKLLAQNLMLACEFEKVALRRIREDQKR